MPVSMSPERQGSFPSRHSSRPRKNPAVTATRTRYDFAVAELPPQMVSTLGKVKYIGEGDISARPTDPTGHLYLALGFPNSANKKVDHVHRVVPNRIWPYAGLAVRNDALARK